MGDHHRAWPNETSGETKFIEGLSDEVLKLVEREKQQA
jgi:hypothetical protein